MDGSAAATGAAATDPLRLRPETRLRSRAARSDAFCTTGYPQSRGSGGNWAEGRVVVVVGVLTSTTPTPTQGEAIITNTPRKQTEDQEVAS